MKLRCGGLLAAMAVVAVTAHSARAVNLLANPGFELPVLAGGDTFGAVGWTDFGGGTYTIKVSPHSGDNAFKTFGGTSGAFQSFAASAGQLWQGSAWILNPNFDAMAGAQIATANIEWRDAGNNLISFLGSAPPITAATPQGSGPSGYTQVTVAGVAPLGTANARFVLLTGSFTGPGGGAPFFDDASFEQVPEPASLMLAGAAVLGIAALRRRR